MLVQLCEERTRRQVVEERLREEELWEKEYHSKRRRSLYGSQNTKTGLLDVFASSLASPFQSKKNARKLLQMGF